MPSDTTPGPSKVEVGDSSVNSPCKKGRNSFQGHSLSPVPAGNGYMTYSVCIVNRIALMAIWLVF